MLAGPLQLFSQSTNTKNSNANIKSKGYAGRDEQGKMTQWNFDRRAVDENDILIEIKFSGIFHSDIHTIK